MGVITKTVTVRHSPAETSPGALVAALNAAHLDASLTSARKQAALKRSWLPPWNILLAAALLVISCVHYLAGPTGSLLVLSGHRIRMQRRDLLFCLETPSRVVHIMQSFYPSLAYCCSPVC